MTRPLKLFALAFSLLLALPTIGLAGHVMPQIKDIVTGDGAEATPYATVAVHYTGWLTDGTKFDSSVDRGQTFSFTLGGGQVIPGWEMGVQGMRVGGKRELIIPPELGYGAKGASGVIPPNATLKFEISLIGVTPAPFTSIDNVKLKDLLAKGVKIVDVRRPEEWKQTGVVAGSKLLMSFDKQGKLNPDFLDGLAAYVKKDEPVILICRTGNRTGYLSNALSSEMGYSKIYNVTDGIVKWMADKNPVDKF
ncbi:MAG: FKBP-type peptidyl-prolyl cis-trans isomerase [Alphaproteobacteria bacterium]